MKFLTTIIGILPVLCVVAPASAALRAGGGTTATSNPDGRISTISIPGAVNLAAARRLPTLKVTGTATTTATTTTATTTAVLMDDIECVERYTECIKASDVCDFNFEECTTPELFYAKKPQCNSVLLQCSAAGINTLFGTSDLTQLSVTNSALYPSAGSIVGQFIDAGAISNRLDTSSCVKRYTSCLKKDNVCGEDFELCTTNSEFKKQKIYCESTLARCQEDGIKELFGLTDTSRDPTSQSRLGVMISEGAGLAAVNAVSTCYKVADQCVLAACSANPYRCMEGSSTVLSATVDAINEGRTLTNEQMQLVAEALTKQQVSKYIKNACFDTIGGNKYCHMTVNEGKMPSSKALIDEEERDNVYADIIGPTMKRVDTQLQKILDKFDKKAKDTCSDTITACAMRSCGSGLGSLCYSRVFGSGNSASDFENSINGAATYNEIKTGCESIVNSDANCQYAAASATAKNYNYSYNEETTFTNLFPADSGKDPIGVITRLNASLAQNYNNAAIEQMGKDCKTTAVSCIRSMCGSDFTNCYRNRTDVMTDTYGTVGTGSSMSRSTSTNSIDEKFAKSMNKVGGVLDFTIVRGLCVNIVKDSPKCEEHLKIQTYRNYTDGNGKNGWGDSKTVRDAWVDAVSTGYNARKVDSSDVLIGCVASSATAPNGQECDIVNPHECDTVDDNGCVYDQEKYESINVYQLNMQVDTLFQEVMADLELEAQAEYNAKLTAEQHMCIDANNGGIMGKNDLSSTYMWVKLRNNRIPKNYSVNGLKSNEFVASNELYGSFCRARVTIQSDDPDIQNYLQTNTNAKNWSTAYFAVGDVFTCGSWIPQKELEKVANRFACKKAKVEGKIDHNFDCRNASDDTIENLKLTVGQQWAVAASAVGGAGLLGAGMDLLQTKTGIGGLLTTRDKTTSTQKQLMQSYSNAEKLYESICNNQENTNCKVLNNSTEKEVSGCFAVDSHWVDNKYMIETYTYKPGGVASCKSLHSYMTKVASMAGYNETTGTLNDQNWWKEYGARATADAVAATAGGVVGGIGVANAIKAANRQQFTADEQQFMNNVGEHIYCFIGADEAGTYGDLIEISVE